MNSLRIHLDDFPCSCFFIYSYLLYTLYTWTLQGVPNGWVPGCHFSQALRVFSHQPFSTALSRRKGSGVRETLRKKARIAEATGIKQGINPISINQTDQSTHTCRFKTPRVLSVYLFLLMIAIYIYIFVGNGASVLSF